MHLSDILSRRYDYNAEQQWMLDRMTDQATGESYVQTLCCYTPDEMVNLTKDLGFKVLDIFPGGRMDYSSLRYHETATLDECMGFTCVLGRAD